MRRTFIPDGIQWTETKQQNLREQLVGFWAQDEWDMLVCPLLTGRWLAADESMPIIRFTCASPALNTELKYACWQKLERGEWSSKAYKSHWSLHLQVLLQWLNHVAPYGSSLLEKSVAQWEISLRSYLVERGLWKEYSCRRLDNTQHIRVYRYCYQYISVFRQIYRIIAEEYDERLEYDKDNWNLRRLGIKFDPSKSGYTLNFTSISQPWLRAAVKHYIRYCLSHYAPSMSYQVLTTLNRFSAFLSECYPSLQPSEITRSVIVEYLASLATSKLEECTKHHHLLYLRSFFDLSNREGWAPVPEKQLIYDEDIPRRPKTQPRFIPEDVLAQLNQHLDSLPSHYMRMVLVLQECGMRISELCTMSRDCLTQDATGDWFLRYYQNKMKKEHSIPISREIAAVIQEQQQAVQSRWDEGMPFLFPASRGRPIQQRSFINAINTLANRKGIRDATGKPYHFQSHQFRHTVGTRMINNGVPQHIIQRYLGHASPGMTSVYAHVHDQTLKEEFAKFRGKIVNVQGQVVEETVPSSELQWLKKNILAQALPNGYCSLPIAAGPCPHANACLTCAHFRTDRSFLEHHRQQLIETQSIITLAREKNWSRQLEMNERVEQNLQAIITTLEGQTDDA